MSVLSTDSPLALAQAFANDSQLTLVAPGSSACTALALSADSVLNTTFISDEGPLYKLKSSGTGPRTDLIRCGAPDAVVATFDRRILGNVVLRPNGEKVRASKWTAFVKTNVVTVSPMTFTSGSDTYVWAANFAGHMVCFMQGASSDPVAWYQRGKSVVSGSSVTQAASFAFSLDAEELVLREDILLAWIIFSERVRATASQVSGSLHQAQSTFMTGQHY